MRTLTFKPSVTPPRARRARSLRARLAPLALLAGALAAVPLAASGALAAGTTRAHTSATPRLLGGVNIPGADSVGEADHSIRMARKAKARLVRTDVNWSTLEPRAPGHIDPAALAIVDRLAADAAHDHIRIVMTVGSSPCWATTAPAALARKCRPGLVTKANAFPPSDPAAYASFAAFLAHRYAGQLAAIEVWNEPDQANERYFGGRDKVTRYAGLLRAAYPAIKAAAPGVTVLGGSLVGFNGKFLKALYDAGIKGFYDGLSVHYYTLTVAALRLIHETQLANGDRTPLWLDEFGWGSCWPTHRIEAEQPCTTRGVQAANVTSMFQALNGLPYVAAAILYKLHDSGSEDFGVIAAGERPKPAFKALQRVLMSAATRPARPRLRLAARGSHVVATGTGPVGDFMVLEAQGATLRYNAKFVLDRFDRFTLALPPVLGTHGLRVRVYQFASGPTGATQRSI